jgi:hypothetical protein
MEGGKEEGKRKEGRREGEGERKKRRSHQRFLKQYGEKGNWRVIPSYSASRSINENFQEDHINGS